MIGVSKLIDAKNQFWPACVLFFFCSCRSTRKAMMHNKNLTVIVQITYIRSSLRSINGAIEWYAWVCTRAREIVYFPAEKIVSHIVTKTLYMYHNTIEHGLCIFSAIGQRGNMNQGSEQKNERKHGASTFKQPKRITMDNNYWKLIIVQSENIIWYMGASYRYTANVNKIIGFIDW